MKERISATIDKKTALLINEIIKHGKYRNKSHVIEDSIEQLWEKLMEAQKNDKYKK